MKTVVDLDLVGYSSICRDLEDGLGARAIVQLNDQIQHFVDQGLEAIHVARADAVVRNTGDGAIVVLDHPPQAHDFSAAVHNMTRLHNATKTTSLGKRLFRIGMATGELVLYSDLAGGKEMAGMVIARAVRLEAKARPGEALCDLDTFAGLTPDQQRCYSKPESVAGKRGETFEARRSRLNPDADQDAEFFSGRTDEPLDAWRSVILKGHGNIIGNNSTSTVLIDDSGQDS